MIYIQGADGLQAISSKLTKEKIIAALGYTPADGTSFFEDESGALVVADKAGYIIAQIDDNGFRTTKVSAKAIAIDGHDLAQKLQELEDRVPEIDLSNYYTKDQVDEAIQNIEIPEVNFEGYATEKFVEDAVAAIEHPTVDLSLYALNADVEANKVLTDAHAADATIHVTSGDKSGWNNHAANADIHVTSADKNKWNSHVDDEDIHVTVENKEFWDAKSEFSGYYNDLMDAPHIVNSYEDELIVSDSHGNVLLRATADGLNAAAIYANGKRVSFPDYTEADEGKTLKIVDGVPTWA